MTPDRVINEELQAEIDRYASDLMEQLDEQLLNLTDDLLGTYYPQLCHFGEEQVTEEMMNAYFDAQQALVQKLLQAMLLYVTPTPEEIDGEQAS